MSVFSIIYYWVVMLAGVFALYSLQVTDSIFKSLSDLNILEVAIDYLWLVNYYFPQTSYVITYCQVPTHYAVLVKVFFTKTFYTFFLQSMCTKSYSISVFNFALKFILLIAMLIFVRGGIPRYRYDFLTKTGWIKFLTLIIFIFLTSVFSVLLL